MPVFEVGRDGKSMELFTINSATRAMRACIIYHTLRETYGTLICESRGKKRPRTSRKKKFFSDRYRRSMDFAVVVVVVSDYILFARTNGRTCVHAEEFRLIDIRNEHTFSCFSKPDQFGQLEI
jgi:hypothetical protein